ncbi:hypothetical protein [Bacillus cereus group sp. BY6-1LC]|uniref:hypothetical protein n=1 Tax=Bacillus cereus group sp. BY6-1LC TaxID=3018077 RepID=UPI0022DF0536|nr:hypothetical protein [Bacillus cereus group sp. BY6-1LC]MDA1802816.1 hypothetical protein [Bacillus cereus group sp. BY6-1LC]
MGKNIHLHTKERGKEAKEFFEFIFGEQEKNKEVKIYFRLICEQGENLYPRLGEITYGEMDFAAISNLYAYQVKRDKKDDKLKRVKNGRWNKKLFLATNNSPEKKDGIYFNFNSGGTSKTDINRIRNVGLDFDFKKVIYSCKTEKEAKEIIETNMKTGEFREEYAIEEMKNGSFKLKMNRTQEVIDRMKKELLTQFQHLFKYMWVNETRNGLHAYLPIQGQGNTSNDAYGDFCVSFGKLFGKWEEFLDVKCLEISHVLRVPGFYHHKDEPFMVKTVQRPKEKEVHNYEKWARVFGFEIKRRIPETITRNKDRSDRKTEKTIGSASLKVKETLGLEPQQMTREEFIEFVHKKHIGEFFENPELLSGSNFCCHFHSDTRPSANISFNIQTGKYYYHCHAEKTGCTRHARNIFQVIRETCKFSKFEQAVNKLAKMCNVEIVVTEFEINQKFKYIRNQSFLFNLRMNAEAGEISSDLQKYLCTNTRLRVLEMMLQKAVSVVVKEEYSYKGHAIFFASLNHLADYLKLDRKAKTTVHKEIKMLLLLGMVGRVPFEQVPEKLRKTSEAIKLENEEHAKAKGDTKEENVINYYYIDDFNDAIELAEERAKLLKGTKFTIKNHLNKNALITLFGQEVADDVFADERTIPKWAIELSQSMKKKIEKEINQKQYVREDAVLKTDLYKIKKWNKEKQSFVRKKPTKKEMETAYNDVLLNDSEVGFKRQQINPNIRKIYQIDKKEKGFILI